MYELCKQQIENKIRKGTLTQEYISKMKRNLGIFKLAEEITDDQYLELIELTNQMYSDTVSSESVVTE